MSQTHRLRASILLVLAALIWGLAFAAQRISLDTIGPFYFNALRCLLGAACLAIFLWLRQRFAKQGSASGSKRSWRLLLIAGIVCGTMMFGGISLQQIGMQWTSAGKAAFLTGFYIVLVPIASLFLGKRPSVAVYFGAFLAIIGLGFLSLQDNFSLSKGDALELLGTLFWTGHILCIGYFSTRVDPVELSLVQVLICAIFSFVPALFTEAISFQIIQVSLIPLLYAGVASVGIAYTLQVIGQKDLHAAPASLILSLEMVFAALGGWLILKEQLNTLDLIGCGLMFAGIVLAQVFPNPTKKSLLSGTIQS